jgi:hypothetical protein
VDAVKRGGGRPKCSAHLYAEELGISFRRLRTLGGEACLRAMSPDALAVMLRPGPIGGKPDLPRSWLGWAWIHIWRTRCSVSG